MRAIATEAELERALAGFIERIKQGIRVESIVLYGSYATGKADGWSDLDVAVVSPDFEALPMSRRQEILAGLAVGTDPRIAPIGYASTELRGPMLPALLREIVRTGKVIYRAPAE